MTLTLPTRTFPLERRDRQWLSSHVAYLIGPMSMPGIDDIRSAAGELMRQYPKGRLDWRLDGAGGRWVADRSPESLVTEGQWEPDQTAGDLLGTLRGSSSDAAPLIFVRYPEHLGVAVSHAIADGRNAMAMLSSLAYASIGGEIAEWASRPGRRSPLLTAGVKTFGAHPAKIRECLQDRHPHSSDAVAGTVMPWQPSPRVIAATFDKSAADPMLAWAREQEPRPSYFALMTCALLRAFRVAGLAVAKDVSVMVDIRRYLGQDWIDGNFIANVPMPVDADTAPQHFSTMVRTTMRSGRPVASQMLSSWRLGRPGRPMPAPATAVDMGLPARITLTDIGTPPHGDRLPIVGGRLPEVYGAGVGDGPHGMTVCLGHSATSTTITVSFNDNVIDAHRVRRALGVLSADPSALVCSGSAAL